MTSCSVNRSSAIGCLCTTNTAPSVWFRGFTGSDVFCNSRLEHNVKRKRERGEGGGGGGGRGGRGYTGGRTGGQYTQTVGYIKQKLDWSEKTLTDLRCIPINNHTVCINVLHTPFEQVSLSASAVKCHRRETCACPLSLILLQRRQYIHFTV